MLTAGPVLRLLSNEPSVIGYDPARRTWSRLSKTGHALKASVEHARVYHYSKEPLEYISEISLSRSCLLLSLP